MKFKFTKEQQEFNDKYKLDDSHYWACHGNPVLYHSTCERIAVMESINNLKMDVVEIDSEARLAVIKCTGKLGERVEVSYGEASPKNTNSAYFVAMAEKRAKDRVILKLVDMGGLVYSESDVIKDKEGKWQFADEVDTFEMTTKEELAKAKAELDKMEQDDE
tara:strand:+ start:1561 stop:2046 length:486 start_codon:yes stop_codon:yes gene_type:complete